MLQLAIECSGFHGSVAVFRDTEPLELVQLPSNQSSVQSLAIAISSSLRQYASRPDFISITSGPGSFTGLRVGLATAKMLGFAWNTPIVAVDTLEVLAWQMQNQLPYQDSTILIPVLDAFRQQVFTAAWRQVSTESIMRLSPTQVVAASQWQASPMRSQTPLSVLPFSDASSQQPNWNSEFRIAVAGPGLTRYLPSNCAAMPISDSTPPMTILQEMTPSALFVASLGWKLFQEDRFVSANQLTANYVRPSAAEDKLPK